MHKKAAFIGLLNTISPYLPEPHIYPSLSNCANIFSPVKTNHIGAGPFIVTLVG